MRPQCFPRRWGRFISEVFETKAAEPCSPRLVVLHARQLQSCPDKCRIMAVPTGAGCGLGVFIGLWLIFDRQSFNWQAIASIATLLMTLFIQRSEHRDTQAIHAKLDELLRAQGDAKKGLTTLDDKEPEQIEAFRRKVRAK